MLIAVIRIVASESRWLKRAARPSPRKTPLLRDRCRRFLAVASSIRPAFMSASMAICLPGSASSVKRAVTSAVRTAPWLTTRN